MEPMEVEVLLRKLDRRTHEVEQILPTLPTRGEMQEAIDAAVRPLATREELAVAVAKLATKEELAAAVAKLATKEELAAAVAKLATKEELAELRQEVREEGERTRRHFDVVAESMHDDVRLIAESHVGLLAEVRRDRKDVSAILKSHDKRITRLEASEARRRKQR